MRLIWLLDFISVFCFSILGFLSITKQVGDFFSIILFIILAISLIDLSSTFYSMRTVIDLIDNKMININKKEDDT